MKRFISAIIVSSLVLVGLVYAVGMTGAASHAMHGDMESTVPCATSCAGTQDTAPSSAACVTHCLNAVAEARTALPTFIGTIILALALVLFLLRKVPAVSTAPDILRRFSDAVARMFQHAQIATIVLRN